MTTNIERTARILMGEGMFTAEAHCYAQALADAGLLMPNLPEPLSGYENVFRVASPLLDCRSAQAVGGQVAIHGHKSRYAPIEEARRFALAIIAAADCAEQEQDNV